MAQRLSYLKETPSQTAGPYVHIGLTPQVAGVEGVYPEDPGLAIAGPEAKGQRIRIEGRIFDGQGDILRDALVELWQADAAGIYKSPNDPRAESCDPAVLGWGRAATDLKTGVFAFDTVKPGPVPGPGQSIMAPHVSLWIVARGINLGLATRMYFPDEEAANAADPILGKVLPPARRETLIASAEQSDAAALRYRFEIRLQGEDETVFFDC
ncbi:MAG: protocatechuate 3,4-dioxygenase subunit alpha [Rhodovibrionaceae bacterium]